MKKRTIIGVICMIAAVAITFLVAPIVNRLTAETDTAIRLSQDVNKGVEITKDMLETVEIKSGSLPSGALTDESQIIGKYASSLLYAGDYLTIEKISGEANTASDVFATLDGTKVAVSVTIDTFAAGLSGKLENGDIISLIIVDKPTGTASIPAPLRYMKVITTTTSGGIDQDSIVKNEDGSYEIPSTVTLLCNTEQAMLLAKYESETTLTVALVYRGSSENAKLFLDKQDEYFSSGAYEAEYGSNSSGENAENSGENDDGDGNENNDPVQQANDIINGNADYYTPGGGGNE